MSLDAVSIGSPAGTAVNRIAGLDGLRAIAAAMVFLQHRAAIPIAVNGVQLFFVLSGFLIIGGILRDLDAIAVHKTTRTAAIRRFYLSRALRILPLYGATLAGAAVLLWLGVTSAVSWQEIGWNAVFLGNVYIGAILAHWTPALSHLWSLAIEEQFYFFLAPLAFLGGRCVTRIACIGLVVLGVASAFYLHQVGATEVRSNTDSLTGFALIALGGLVASERRSFARLFSETAVLLLLGLYLTTALYFAGGRSPAGVTHLSLVGLSAALIAGVAARPDCTAVRFLEARPLAWLGRLSYSFYLCHYWVTAEMVKSASFDIIDLTGQTIAVQFLPLLGLSLGIAWLSWAYVEQPMLRPRNRRVGRQHATPSGPIAHERLTSLPA